MGTITKRPAGDPDNQLWDGSSTETYSALTSTGRTMTLNKLGASTDYDWHVRLGDVITRGPWVDVRSYDASGSSTSTTGSITTGTKELTIAAAEDFRDRQGVRVVGAGLAGVDLITTIVSGQGTTTLVLENAAQTTVAAADVYHSDSEAITSANDAIVAAGGGILRFPAGSYVLGEATTLSATVLFQPDPGCRVTTQGFTFTVTDQPFIGEYQVFSDVSASRDEVVFGNAVGEVKSAWWGLDYESVLSAYNSLPSKGGTIHLPQAEIDFEGNELNVLKENVHFVGTGEQAWWTDTDPGTRLYTSVTTGSDYMIKFGDDDTGDVARYASLRMITFDGNDRGTAANGVLFDLVGMPVIIDCRFEKFDGTAMKFRDVDDFRMDRIDIFTSGSATHPALYFAGEVGAAVSQGWIGQVRVEKCFGTHVQCGVVGSEAYTRNIKAFGLKLEGHGWEGESGGNLLELNGYWLKYIGTQFHNVDPGHTACVMGNTRNSVLEGEFNYHDPDTLGVATGITMSGVRNTLRVKGCESSGALYKFDGYFVDVTGTAFNNDIEITGRAMEQVIRTSSDSYANSIRVNIQDANEVSLPAIQLDGTRNRVSGILNVESTDNIEAGSIGCEILGAHCSADNLYVRGYDIGFNVDSAGNAKIRDSDAIGTTGTQTNGIIVTDSDYVQISGCRVHFSQEASIEVTDCSRISIHNNYIYWPSQAGTGLHSGILFIDSAGGGNDCSVKTNYFQSDISTPVVPDYWVTAPAGFTRVHVEANTYPPSSFVTGVYNISSFGLTAKNIVETTSDVSNPPTDAELDALFGTPATVGDGWIGVVDDDGTANYYLCVSSNGVWLTFAGTVAV